jgi:A/G-specific adenine glycosylase
MNLSEFFSEAIVSWSTKNLREFPWRSSQDPWAILLAETLLQRTLAPQVVGVFSAVLERYPTSRELALASDDILDALIQPAGLKKKGVLLRKLALKLQSCEKSDLQSLDTLLALPGIGMYSARAVQCFGFGQRVPIVDANVIRVFGRFFGKHSVRPRPRDDIDIWNFAESLVPQSDFRLYNLGLLDFGADICRPRKPACDICVLRARCLYRQTVQP